MKHQHDTGEFARILVRLSDRRSDNYAPIDKKDYARNAKRAIDGYKRATNVDLAARARDASSQTPGA